MSKSIQDFKYKKGHYAYANTWNLKKKLPKAIKITGDAAGCHSFQTNESVLTS